MILLEREIGYFPPNKEDIISGIMRKLRNYEKSNRKWSLKTWLSKQVLESSIFMSRVFKFYKAKEAGTTTRLVDIER